LSDTVDEKKYPCNLSVTRERISVLTICPATGMTSYQIDTLFNKRIIVTPKLLKPAEYAEQHIIRDILSETWAPGDALPAERVLAQQLGITRPTLRETLQRLSREGWVTIRHGKPTQVNHYLENGGLAILSALVRYGRQLPKGMVDHLLEVRSTMLPDIAEKAVQKNPHQLLAHLEQARDLEPDPAVYAEYDWHLQVVMVKACENPVFNMIFNDFAPLYAVLGQVYFSNEKARSASLAYYRELLSALQAGQPSVSGIVDKIMRTTRQIWQEIQ
jgi:GntR family negative regulator for fad regulon and positive regulator of fabA